ncbi:hypothetical protein HBI56_134130 [Parastagonospora nodorum]|nr:hypothetical protein HBH52_095030 [Parastagonospora nodorum]KAH4108219.1 hypothetical protein HBH46_042240 [Parastagonospora nodorum]KAH4201336.1 hypothetical protein HBH42_028210 [Parastagonospora nodorum]KAH4234172.1 hypothetical protein HBI05_154650 [Parastagonospora nodorum]KAH4244052.1 hypothetical protein HBI06_005780 [Parastagonospora nodorum]
MMPLCPMVPSSDEVISRAAGVHMPSGPRVAGAHGLSSRPSGADVDHNRACHARSRTKGTIAEAARNQAEGIAVRSVMQATAVISLNQRTQAGAPTPSRTRREPTRLAACTVSRASQWVQDQHWAAGA